MRRTIRVFVLFLLFLLASCQPIGITSDQPEELLNNTVTEPPDASPETDSDALFNQHDPEMSGLAFDPENQMPGFDLPEEPLTEEEIAFFKDLLATIITEVDQEEATDSLREIINLNDRNNQQKKKSTIEKESISREEKRRQRLAELTAQYLKELQGRHVGGSPSKKNINTATFPPGLAAIGAEPIPSGGAVVTDKTQETLDLIEAARLAQQQLATQPIQVPDKQPMDQQIGGRPVTYKYDTNDNIIEKNANGVITRYHVNANRRYAVILAEYDGEGNLLANYTYEEGDHKPTCQYRNGHKYCYRYDDRNVRAITNENGEVTDRYRYDAFGNVTEHIKTENSVISHFLANGEYYDEDAGLYRLRARHYDPQTGRFISRDSWGGRGTDPITQNQYLYANGNPMMYSDPSGHNSIISLTRVLSLLTIVSLTAFPVPSSTLKGYGEIAFMPEGLRSFYFDLFGRDFGSTLKIYIHDEQKSNTTPPEGKAEFRIGSTYGIHVRKEFYAPPEPFVISTIAHEIAHSIQFGESVIQQNLMSLRHEWEDKFHEGESAYDDPSTLEGEARDIENMVFDFLYKPLHVKELGNPFIHQYICRNGLCEHKKSLVIREGTFY